VWHLGLDPAFHDIENHLDCDCGPSHLSRAGRKQHEGTDAAATW
jgi:hypothetical protein